MDNTQRVSNPAVQQKNDTTVWVRQIQNSLLKMLEEKVKALPDGFNKDRFVMNSITMINDMLSDKKKSEKIRNVSQASIVMCLMKGAFLGLDFLNGECYAIPYGENMNFQTDYKGEIKVCKKHSINPIKDIFAKVVREGDAFSETVEDGRQRLIFNPVPFSDAPIIGAFAVVTYRDGTMLYETMSKAEIENVRTTYSKAKDSQAWTASTGEMYKKTVLRRLCKFIELDFDNEQLEAFNDGSGMQFDETAASASKPLAIAEKEQPIDVMAQIKSQSTTPKQEPVAVSRPEPMQDEFEQFEQQYVTEAGFNS